MMCLGGAVFVSERVGLGVVVGVDVAAACRAGAAFRMASISGVIVVMSNVSQACSLVSGFRLCGLGWTRNRNETSVWVKLLPSLNS
jgi:hypothetical protein